MQQSFFVIVRSDLTPGQMIAQACHAALTHYAGDPGAKARPEADHRIVVLEADGADFSDLLAQAEFLCPSIVTSYADADLGQGATAFVVGPTGDRLTLPSARRARLCLTWVPGRYPDGSLVLTAHTTLGDHSP